MDTPVPVLQYADAPARWGITFEHNGPQVTITIPRRTSFSKAIAETALMTLIACLAFSIFALARASIARGPIAWVLFLLSAILALVAIAFPERALTDFLLALFRLSKPMVIELNAESLTIHNSDPANPKDLVRPRSAVYEINYVPHSRTLAIHSHGHKLLKCRPCPDPAVLRWIANTLTAALQESAP